MNPINAIDQLHNFEVFAQQTLAQKEERMRAMLMQNIQLQELVSKQILELESKDRDIDKRDQRIAYLEDLLLQQQDKSKLQELLRIQSELNMLVEKLQAQNRTLKEESDRQIAYIQVLEEQLKKYQGEGQTNDQKNESLISGLKVQLANLRNQMKLAAAQIDQKNTNIVDLENKLHQAKREQSEMTKLKDERIASLEAEIRALSEKSSKDLENLLDQIRQLEKLLKEQTQRNQEANESQWALINEKDTTIAKLQQQLKDLTKETDLQKADLRAQLQQRNLRIQQQSEELASLEAKISQLEGLLNDKRRENSDLIERLAQQTNLLRQNIVELEEKLQQSQLETRDLDKQNKDLKAEKQALLEKIDELNRQSQRREKNYQEKESDLQNEFNKLKLQFGSQLQQERVNFQNDMLFMSEQKDRTITELNGMISHQKETIVHLESELKVADEKLLQLQDDISKLKQRSRSEYQQIQNSQEGKVKQLNDQLLMNETTIAGLQTILSQKDSTIRKLTEMIDKLQAELDEVNNRQRDQASSNAKDQETIKSLKEEVKRVQKQVMNLIAEAKQAQSNHDELVAQLNQKIKDLQNQLQGMINSETEKILQKQLLDLQESLRDQKNENQASKKKIQSLEDKIHQNEDELIQLNQQIRELQEMNEQTKLEVQKQKLKNENLIEQNNQQEKQLKQANNELWSQIETLQKQIRNLIKQQSELQQMLESEKEKNGDSEDKISDLQRQLSSVTQKLQNTVNQQKTLADDANEEIQKLQSQLRNSSGDSKILLSQIEELKMQVQDQEINNKDLNEQQQKLQQLNKKLKLNIEELKQALSSQETELSTNYQQKIFKLEQTQLENQHSLDLANNEIKQLTIQLQKVSPELAETSKLLRLAQQQRQELQDVNDDLTAQLEGKLQEIRRQRQDINENVRLINELREQIAPLQTSIFQYRLDSQRSEQQIRQLENVISELRALNQELSEYRPRPSQVNSPRQSEMKDQITLLNEQVKTLQSQLNQQLSSETSALTAITQADQRVRDLNNELTILQSQYKQLTQKYVSSENYNSQLQEQLRVAINANDQQESNRRELIDLRRRVKEAMEALENRDYEIGILAEEIRILKSEAIERTQLIYQQKQRIEDLENKIGLLSLENGRLRLKSAGSGSGAFDGGLSVQSTSTLVTSQQFGYDSQNTLSTVKRDWKSKYQEVKLDIEKTKQYIDNFSAPTYSMSQK